MNNLNNLNYLSNDEEENIHSNNYEIMSNVLHVLCDLNGIFTEVSM